MSPTLLGVSAMVGCCAVWGLSPLYYRMLSDVPPADILAHRTIWSVAFFLLILWGQGRLQEARTAFGDGQVRRIAVAAVMISINWFVFILSIQIGRVTESGLGYYMMPLASVVFGFLIFQERLSRAQWFAVGLAALAVVTLTLGLGVAPWISLTLAVSFALYGVIKKGVTIGPVVSVFAEVAFLSPIAVIWLVVVAEHLPSASSLALLMLSGPLTAAPLILFSFATKRIRLSTVGILQYINPTLQVLVALTILKEPATLWHAVAFPLIWIALAVYSSSAVSQERTARNASINSGTP